MNEANKSIHIMANNLINRLTLIQMQMFLYMFAEVKKSGEKSTYKIFVSDLLNIKTSGKEDVVAKSLKHLYGNARSILQSLLNTYVTITTERKGVVYEENIALIESFNYCYNAGYFYFKFSMHVKEHILNLDKQHTSFGIRNILFCNSVYSVRMYMILKSFGGLKEIEIPVDKLKEMLGIGGKYKLYGELRSKVLNVAQKELKNSGAIYFTYENIKRGRKVVATKFTIKKQKKKFVDEKQYVKTDIQKIIPYQEWCEMA